MKITRKQTILLVISIVAIILLITGWCLLLSPTRIAFVNYQTITLGQIARANDNSFVSISELTPDELHDAGSFDMIFVNGMGLRITDEQRQQLIDAASSGTHVMTTAATNPQNHIMAIDSIDAEFLKQYLAGDSRANYRSMLNYVRRYVDGKRLFAGEMSDPTVSGVGLLYHPDVKDTSAEHLQFATVAEYDRYLMDNGLMAGHDAPRIILCGQMGVPDSLIAHLERIGCVVYPVNSIQTFISRGHADSITPSAMINMAHGRMGDMAVNYLRRHNISLFSPLNVNRGYTEWMDDKMGMSGGFMSQSVVTPEIDGAIRPFSLFAHFDGDDGLPYADVIPGRVDEFVTTVNNYLSLRAKPNSEKKIAVFYFKGPGQNAMVAEGMEVAPSLYNLLVRLRQEGYDVTGLPSSPEALEAMIGKRGKVFGNYATGAQQDFVRDCDPQIISREDYMAWASRSFSPQMLEDINSVDGPFPGHGLKTPEGDMAIARLQFGNVVLIPQTAAGIGDDDFKIVHGTEMAPPHAYAGAYLWARHGFGADALIHFGAHGSLEFTPRKQVALGSNDWPDRLVGPIPHFYIYSTSNVGEAMIAKRRTYAAIVNYLTPPFMESNLRGVYRQLSDAIEHYNREAWCDTPDPAEVRRAALDVKRHTVRLGIHRELKLDSTMSVPYSDEEIARVENFAEELANEKIMGALYVMGQPYAPGHLRSTVKAMTVDPVAYSLFALDKSRGKAPADLDRHRSQFNARYIVPATALVDRYLTSRASIQDADICRIASISPEQLAKARAIDSTLSGSKDMFTRMMVMGSMMPPAQPTASLAKREGSSAMKNMMKMAGMTPEKALEAARKMGADEKALKKMEQAMKNGSAPTATAKGRPASAHGAPKGMAHPGMGKAPSYTKAEIDEAAAIMEVVRAVTNINTYYDALAGSPEAELSSTVNALAGGYVAPTSGGDPVLNPSVLPTGRNMFAVNAEETPSSSAWEKGKALVDNTLDLYRKAHSDSLPRKVSYTLWSSEFIETEGATIAQVLYMLGVEPVRDPFGRVTDLRLIPSAELGRPRIDVVVQTSGQLRDLAASRLFLIDRAVKMAAAADDKEYPNFVAQGAIDAERALTDRGVTPKEARELSTARVFGGVNGNYGSGIQEMVEAGDRWDNEDQIAETYIHNMGAYYGSEADWEKMRDYAFEAALTNTDAVVQPRQSNTWGALSLDHVYEFMGGMNLAARKVNGKDPEAYLSDYRNRNNVRMQDVKEAIGVESRATILNPTFIKEKMKGGAADAAAIADVVRNTYGWNVMKPAAIDNELWDNIYATYVEDRDNLGTKEYFSGTNPAALQELTAVMLETSRKGMWKASPEQIARLAELHTEMVEKYDAACSGFVCDNAKLRDYIAANVSKSQAEAYRNSISAVRDEAAAADGDGMVMQKETLNEFDSRTTSVNGIVIAGAVAAALLIFFILIVRRRKAANKKQ